MTSEQRMLRAIARGVPNPRGLAQYALDHPGSDLGVALTILCAETEKEIILSYAEMCITVEDDPVLEFIGKIKTLLKDY